MDIVNERERGKLPLSIGTSLAFESLLGIHDEVKHNKPLLDLGYQVIWINIKTLYRNLYHAVEYDRVGMASDVHFIRAMHREMETIRDICSNEAKGIIPVFYSSDYRGLEKINPEVLLRMDNTDLQKTFTRRMSICLKEVIEEVNQDTDLTDPNRIKIFDNKITEFENRKTIMVTSYPYDLTSHRKFNQLALLETHTGALKERDKWYTKYQVSGQLKANMPEMPFRLDFLTLFGDNSLFRCKVQKFKTTLIDLAKRDKWTPITSTDAIRSSIGTIKDHQIRIRLLATIKD